MFAIASRIIARIASRTGITSSLSRSEVTARFPSSPITPRIADSLVAQWLKKVRVETPARSAIICAVTAESPCSTTSSRAARCIAMRVWRFFCSRRPSSSEPAGSWSSVVCAEVTPPS